jgi:PAS domain S-box-containing protein
MIDEIFNYPELNKYLTSFKTGQIIFLEGDDTQDLFILASGEIEIIKGNKKISEITKRGEFFGEMSFLLGAKRTASAKAISDITAIRIPKSEINNFLNEFPMVAKEITIILAQRLDETSQMLAGLKEFCDQLPDAVVVTNREGKILTWNAVAERMYGLDNYEMQQKSAAEIYEEPEEYINFLEEIQSRYSVRDKILRIKHPERGTRYISTSTTVLYDGNREYQGILSLGRDITAVKNIERRYRRVRSWSIPIILILGFLTVVVFLGYPFLSKGKSITDFKKQGLRDQMGKDYFLLRSLLIQPLLNHDRISTSKIMGDFLGIQKTENLPYSALLLLDADKKVLDVAAVKPGIEASAMIGSSYAGIEFQGKEEALNRLLMLYRTDSNHPMGRKGVEIAFRLDQNQKNLGWLVFQMDMDKLLEKYNCDEEDLKAFQFQRPNP